MEFLYGCQIVLRILGVSFLLIMLLVCLSEEPGAPDAASSILALILSFCFMDGIIGYVKRMIRFNTSNAPSKGERKF